MAMMCTPKYIKGVSSIAADAPTLLDEASQLITERDDGARLHPAHPSRPAT